MQASAEDQALNAVSNFGFMLCTATALFFLTSGAKGDQADNTEIDDDNEEEVILQDNQREISDNFEIYTMMLKDMQRAPDIQVERILSFNEMLNPRRRSYSADDLDALGLISDQRLQAVYDRALSEVSLNTNVTEEYTVESDGRSSRMSDFSTDSWDRLT